MKIGVSIVTIAGAFGALVGGCDGQFETHLTSDGGNDQLAQARAMFDEEILPLLETSCVSCHVGADAVGFMRPNPDVWSSIMAHPNLVIGGDAEASRLYSYGRSSSHSGIEFTTDQAERVRVWIELVPPKDGPPPVVETDKFDPVLSPGTNNVDLSKLAMGLDGATMTFKAAQLSAGIYITELAINAGAGGVHMQHPLFVSHCPGTIPDPVDSFYGLDQTFDPGASGSVGGGTVVLVDFVPGCKLSVHFKKIEPSTGGGPGGPDAGPGEPGGGCVNVTGFTAMARGPLANQCGNCHSGGQATARNAWDITTLADPGPPAQAQACSQTRNKLNLNAEQMSLLFQRVQPGQQTGHPLTLPDAQFTAFRDAVVSWAVTE